jgi:hypothetical protein
MRDEGSGEQYITMSRTTCNPDEILFGCSNQKNEMGWTCSTYGEEERCYRVLLGKPEGKGHL